MYQEMLHTQYNSYSPSRSSEDDDYSDMDISDIASESVRGSIRPGRASPALSLAPSVYSYSSSIDGYTMLRDLHGRIFNSANETYMLPADTTEHGRLDLQHMMLCARLGGLYMRPDYVQKRLAPRDCGPPPQVIDIGTGSGSWAIDMGKEFPHAEVTGLDLAPANLTGTPPPNCRFECDDANLGFVHYANTFDVVHGRCICIGLDNTQAFFQEVASMLKPGGIYLWLEGDLQFYDENHQPRTSHSEDEPGFSWMQKLTHASYHAMKARGADIDMPHMATKWLEQMDAWEEVGSDAFYIQVGPWESENLDEIGLYCSELMRHDALGLIQSMRPLLVSEGYFEETVEKWIRNIHVELDELKTKSYTKWHCGYAIKKS